ncbi:MAG: RNA 2'-phosphotransferase [Labilithrix sp.]|nr:RNA 2'-phosphotransferase [Labilithrix sp.]
MDRARRVSISKRLSLALRHEPASLGLVLDAAGWARVDDVIAGFGAHGEAVSRDDLVEVVATSDKQRFALSENGERVRANQGHSLDVDLGLMPREPPPILFHGTSRDVLEAIRREGLDKRSRAHVHLSADVRTAEIVARRRAGEHVILRVCAGAMHAGGHAFYLSDNGVWLTERVPPEYLED